jgi:hypothetical protein
LWFVVSVTRSSLGAYPRCPNRPNELAPFAPVPLVLSFLAGAFVVYVLYVVGTAIYGTSKNHSTVSRHKLMSLLMIEWAVVVVFPYAATISGLGIKICAF